MPIAVSNGIQIFYEERGRGDPLVLIMGLGADGSVWEKHVAEYEKHFRCILMDNRGVGRSDKPPGPYTTAMMADDVAGLMDTLDISNAHISGISMGGAIAQELVLRHPAKVRSLTLNCTWPQCNAYTIRIFEELKTLYGRVEPVVWIRHVQLLIFSPTYHHQHMNDLLERECEALKPVENPQSPKVYAAQCDACITHDTLDRLGRIAVPTLVTVGDADIFTPLPFARAITERIRGSEMAIFPTCGHAHHWEKLTDFNARTVAFMKAH